MDLQKKSFLRYSKPLSRCRIGLFGDRAINPIKEPFSMIDDWEWEWQFATFSADYISRSPQIIERYKQLKGSSIDPYSSLKNGYTQYRRGAVSE
jgi:ABC-type transporter lipoprotein component MlaA